MFATTLEVPVKQFEAADEQFVELKLRMADQPLYRGRRPTFLKSRSQRPRVSLRYVLRKLAKSGKRFSSETFLDIRRLAETA